MEIVHRSWLVHTALSEEILRELTGRVVIRLGQFLRVEIYRS